MPFISSISLGDQSFVELLFASTTLVPGDQKYCPTFRIERERYAPFAICSLKTQFLHIGVTRAFQLIDMRATSFGSEPLDKGSLGIQFVLHFRR